MNTKEPKKMFDDDNVNILSDALIKASEAENYNDNAKIYDFMNLPKTSFIVELAQAINQLGYKITKK